MLGKACQLQPNSSNLFVLLSYSHPISGFAELENPEMATEKHIATALKGRVLSHLERNSIPEQNLHLCAGHSLQCVEDAIGRLDIDLLILGAHPQGRLSLQQGLAERVLKHLKGDLLTVRLP